MPSCCRNPLELQVGGFIRHGVRSFCVIPPPTRNCCLLPPTNNKCRFNKTKPLQPHCVCALTLFDIYKWNVSPKRVHNAKQLALATVSLDKIWKIPSRSIIEEYKHMLLWCYYCTDILHGQTGIRVVVRVRRGKKMETSRRHHLSRPEGTRVRRLLKSNWIGFRWRPAVDLHREPTGGSQSLSLGGHHWTWELRKGAGWKCALCTRGWVESN